MNIFKWRYWAKALGEKSGNNDSEADTVAIIRTIMFLTVLITNIFIVSGVIRHWNDNTKVKVIYVSR